MAFQFPASPTVNQTFTPVAGTTYRWSGTAWHLLAGPGAFITQAEGDARYRLLTNMTFTGPVLHADGTLAAPGISWTSEPTMGWWRNAANEMHGVTNGIAVLGVKPAGVVVARRLTVSFSLDASYLVDFQNPAASPFGLYINYATLGVADQGHEFFNGSVNNAVKILIWANGGISNNQANNVNTSDAALKTDIVPAPDYTAFVGQLQYRRFKFADEDYETDGLIAQELQAVDPTLVTLAGSELAPESKKLGIYEQRLQQRINSVIPKLIARIGELEARLAVLEGKPA